MTTTPSGGARPRPKGPRPKHVPQRMCIACRDRSSKRTLTRIVRTPEGPVVIDPTGKRNGRGAYICEKPTCWERALRTDVLANALKTTIESEAADMLRRFAAEMPANNDPMAVTAQEDTNTDE